jgi:hypothetical protein
MPPIKAASMKKYVGTASECLSMICLKFSWVGNELNTGFWSNDLVDGPFAYIGNDSNAYGSMKAGKLSGFNVIESEKLVVYGHFANNLLHGTAILRNTERVDLVQYSRGMIIYTKKSM